jgi:phosphate transporter
MGGSALGKAVEASKLLDAMDVIIRHMISGLSFYVVVMVLAVVVLVRTFPKPLALTNIRRCR